MIQVSPSLLAANFANLQTDLASIEKHADWLHLDIMDGHFVPNISFGAPVVKSLRAITKLPFDVHLMITDPDRYVSQFVDAGADMITVHVEACTHLHRSVMHIKELGVKAGVAINPHTPLESIKYVLDEVDLVLLMTVNPGFGGQSFIDSVVPKIEQLSLMTESVVSGPKVAVDGGINMQTARTVVEAGADFLVAGSAVFKSSDPAQAILDLKQ